MGRQRDSSNGGSQNMSLSKKYGKLSLLYPCYPFLSGALLCAFQGVCPADLLYDKTSNNEK